MLNLEKVFLVNSKEEGLIIEVQKWRGRFAP